jgi:large subunit ribosomal protein L21
MYAIVDIAGQQFKVEKNQKIYVHHLEGESGTKIDLDKVLLIDNNQTVIVGSPVIEGAMVYASILDHLKSDKVLVFKKKRRKGYRKLFGHRQYLTQILIEDIIEKGAKARIVAEKTKPVIQPEKQVADKESTLPAGPDALKKVPAASPAKRKPQLNLLKK